MSSRASVGNLKLYHVLPSAIGLAALIISYLYLTEYLDTWTIRIVCILGQLLGISSVLILSKKSIHEWSGVRFIAILTPISFIPCIVLLIDSIHRKDEIGINGIVIEKTMRYAGKGSQLKWIVVKLSDSSIYSNPVLESFYDGCNVGDSVKLDLKKGVLGFRKVTEYYK